MKKIFAIFSILMLAQALQAQKQIITSVASGNFLNPATWDCTCIPTAGASIVVDHNVTLNTSFYATASITINAGGALLQDVTPRDFLFAGTTFSNDGVFMVNRFYNAAGSVTNNGTLAITQSFYNTGILINNSSIGMLDSLQNDYILINAVDAVINSANFTNTDSMVNSGRLIFDNYTNTGNFYNPGITEASYLFNTGYTEMQDSIIVHNAFLNAGTFIVSAGAALADAGDLMNTDTLGFFGTLINGGEVTIGNNFTNTSDISGNEGSFCVANYSVNTGNILGTVDFCDQTPLSGPINIDLNIGTIGTNVTSCTHSCTITGLPESDNNEQTIDVYPNPFNDRIYFNIGKTADKECFRLYDLLGNLLLERSLRDNNITLLTSIPEGLYFYTISNGAVIIKTGKLIHEL